MADKWVHRLRHNADLLILTLAECIPRLLDHVLLHPGTVISIFALYFLGVFLNWTGDAIVFVCFIVYEIINAISTVIHDIIKGIQKVANAVGGGINDVTSFFGGGNVVPTVHIPDPRLSSMIPHFHDLKHLRSYCSAFSQPWYDFTFPLKWLANSHICPVQRYLYGTWLEPLVGWLPAFGPNPMGNNCSRHSMGWLCWVVYLGKMIKDLLVPLVIAVLLLKIFWPFIKQILKTFWDGFMVLVYFISYGAHRIVHRAKPRVRKLTFSQHMEGLFRSV